MTETPEQLLARRRKDRAITRKANRRKARLAVIGDLVVRVDQEPELMGEIRKRIDQFKAEQVK